MAKPIIPVEHTSKYLQETFTSALYKQTTKSIAGAAMAADEHWTTPIAFKRYHLAMNTLVDFSTAVW